MTELYMQESCRLAVERYKKTQGFETVDLKAVFFDMDGVLFDSMPNHSRSWAKVCNEYGLTMTPQEVYLHEGRTGADTINILTRREWGRDTTDEEAKELYAAKCREFAASGDAPKMKGAQAVLDKVHCSGMGIYVVTGSGQKSLLQRITSHFPMLSDPYKIISSKDCLHGKPQPDPYLLALKRAGLRPWQAIVVENAPLGVEAAHRAKIFTIAVNTGPLEDHILTDAGADLLLPNMSALSEGWSSVCNAFASCR